MKLNMIGKLKMLNVKLLPSVGIGAACAVLPVYLVSNALFQAAVLRDKSSMLVEKKVAKHFLKWTDRRKGKKTGLTFSDFREELEQGKAWFQAQDKERITMTSSDGLRLVAYYLPSEEASERVMILMHGYRNDGFKDFAGLVKFYHEMGYHLLVPHQRSHGESEGKYICFGVKERYDLKQWTEYIVKRFGGKCTVFLSGISMGGTTVLMASGLGLPRQVKGIIADCAFTSPWEIFAYIMEVTISKRGFHLPVFLFLSVADWICRSRAGFGFKDCNAVECMKKNEIPVLFIHGGRDDFVPMEMSSRCYDACAAEKKLLMIERAGHGTCNLTEPEVYRSTVAEFMENCTHGN